MATAIADVRMPTDSAPKKRSVHGSESTNSTPTSHSPQDHRELDRLAGPSLQPHPAISRIYTCL